MRIAYSRDDWARGSAWYDLIKNKPVIVLDGHEFTTNDHHFRKDHDNEGYAWYVTRWFCEGVETEPSEKPDPVQCFMWSIPYQWTTWTEYDGTVRMGFQTGPGQPADEQGRPLVL